MGVLSVRNERADIEWRRISDTGPVCTTLVSSTAQLCQHELNFLHFVKVFHHKDGQSPPAIKQNTLKQSNLERASGSAMVLEKKSGRGGLSDPAQVPVVHCVLLKHCLTMAGGWSMEE